MTLVSKVAPNFIASAVMKNGKIFKDFNFHKYVKNSMSVLFFWPMDFTFVCPSEILSFNEKIKCFNQLNVKIVGVSVDSEFSHKAWRNLSIKKGGIGKINYPMVSDIKKEISNLYGILHSELGVSLRATFVIDNNNIIRYQVVNDLSFGRNINEVFRMIYAINFNDKSGKVCPAQWQKGNLGIFPSSKDTSKFLLKNFVK